MLFNRSDAIVDLIVELLSMGPSTAKKLCASVNQTRTASIQAVYDALRQLNESGVILKDKRKYELNREWVHRVTQNLGGRSSFPELLPGDSLTYRFKSYSDLDRYWKHLHMLATENDAVTPIFYFDPHEMWVYQPGRSESQLRFLEDRKRSPRLSYMTLGGSTEHDRRYRRQFAGPSFEIDLNPKTPLARNIHLTVVGEHIIRTKIPNEDAEDIDRIYRESRSEHVLLQNLSAVFVRSGALSVKLVRDHQLACNLRKQLARNFAIPRKLVEQFSLY